MSTDSTDPDRELILERMVNLTPEQVWAAWTRPELLTRWFTPAPWTTPEADIDLRPGGVFRTLMRSPDGETNEGSGCYLEIEEYRRLVWTSALGPGYQPNDFTDGGFPFTAVLSLEPVGDGTRYHVRLMHATADQAAEHAAMGFAEGWGAALDQLVALMADS
jgi:uncharacterized protein YndB with AHSA1/START domain